MIDGWVLFCDHMYESNAADHDDEDDDGDGDGAVGVPNIPENGLT